MLEKGMRVRVKSLSEIKETLRSGKCKETGQYFNDDQMDAYCNKTTTITLGGKHIGIHLEIDNSEWYWSEHWLELIADNTQPFIGFEIGDTVIRISSWHMNMKVGDTAKVVGNGGHGNGSLKLEGYEGIHSRKNLKVITRPLSISNPDVFLIGDIVRRDSRSWNTMEIGDEDEVVAVATTTVNLKRHGRGHDKDRLTVIARVGDCIPDHSTIDHATLHSSGTPDDYQFGIGDQVKCTDAAQYCTGPVPPIEAGEVLTIAKIDGDRFITTKCVGADCEQGKHDCDDNLCLRLEDYELVKRATQRVSERARKFGATSISNISYSMVCSECGNNYGSHMGLSCPISMRIKTGDTVRYLGGSLYARENGFSEGHVGIVTDTLSSSLKIDNSQWWMTASCFEVVSPSTTKPIREMQRGDKVRYAKEDTYAEVSGLKIGNIYTVIHSSGSYIKVAEDTHTYFLRKTSFELVDRLGSVAKETLKGGKDMKPDTEDLEQICKQLNIEIVGTVEDGYYILKDGTIGYFNRETINIQLTQAQQRAIIKSLPDTINSRAFILEEHQLAFQSWKFVQTNQEEMEALQPTASPVEP